MTSQPQQAFRIAARVRPLSKAEKDEGASTVIKMKGGLVEVVQCAQGGPHKATFDHAFWSCNTFVPGNQNDNAPQEVVYTTIGTPMLQNTFDGYNSCLFAYGQTGSGKTYTVMGNPTDEGIAPRMGQDIFQRVKAAEKESKEVAIEVSFLEIYNEKVRDLLNPDPKGFEGKKLRVREHPKHGTFVEGLSQFVVTNPRDLHEMVVVGNRMRTTGATQMNLESSRSHAILTVRVTQTPEATPTDRHPKARISHMHFVDLAGAGDGENPQNDDASLVAFRTVVGQLGEGKFGKSVSHEKSLLTRLMKDALGGNCLTTILATISPSDAAHSGTVAALSFVESARKAKAKAVVNAIDVQHAVTDLQREIVEVKAQVGGGDEVTALDGRIAALRYLAAEIGLLKGERRARTRQFKDEQEANIYTIEKAAAAAAASSPAASSAKAPTASAAAPSPSKPHTVSGGTKAARTWKRKDGAAGSNASGEGGATPCGGDDGAADDDEMDIDLDDLDDLDMDEDGDAAPADAEEGAGGGEGGEDEFDIDLDDLDLDDLDDLDGDDEPPAPAGEAPEVEVDLDLDLDDLDV